MSLTENKRWTTHDELHAASEMSAYRLAAAWGDVTTWPVTGQGDLTDELEELAVMSVLRRWLDGWLPLQAHRALRAGATPAAVAAALGVGLPELTARWRRWADGQRDLHRRTGLGLSDREHDYVAGLWIMDELPGSDNQAVSRPSEVTE